jgi:YjbE family integral membrane protein
MDGAFWSGLASICVINIVLSGDNAVVIAMACRNLPKHQVKWGIIWGTVGAVVARVVLTFVAAWLLQFAYLQIIGGLLLLYIAIHLLTQKEDDENIEAQDSLSAAIKTIIFADVIMSLDNVLGIAAVAGDNFVLLIVGLCVSIPIVVFGATIVLKLMTRFPIITWIGAGILGYVSGEMFVGDKATKAWFEAHLAVEHAVPLLGAAIVVLVGFLVQKKRKAEKGKQEIAEGEH